MMMDPIVVVCYECGAEWEERDSPYSGEHIVAYDDPCVCTYCAYYYKKLSEKEWQK